MRLNQNVRRTRIVVLLLAAGLLVAATPCPAAAQAQRPGGAVDPSKLHEMKQIGRASCRERVSKLV